MVARRVRPSLRASSPCLHGTGGVKDLGRGARGEGEVAARDDLPVAGGSSPSTWMGRRRRRTCSRIGHVVGRETGRQRIESDWEVRARLVYCARRRDASRGRRRASMKRKCSSLTREDQVVAGRACRRRRRARFGLQHGIEDVSRGGARVGSGNGAERRGIGGILSRDDSDPRVAGAGLA